MSLIWPWEDIQEGSRQIGPRKIGPRTLGGPICCLSSKLGPCKLGPCKSGPGKLGSWQIGPQKIGPLENLGAANWAPCNSHICIGYILPTIGEYRSVEFIYCYRIYSANNRRVPVRPSGSGLVNVLFLEYVYSRICIF